MLPSLMSCTVHSPTSSLVQPACILVYIECNPTPGGFPFKLSLGLRSNSWVLPSPSSQSLLVWWFILGLPWVASQTGVGDTCSVDWCGLEVTACHRCDTSLPYCARGVSNGVPQYRVVATFWALGQICSGNYTFLVIDTTTHLLQNNW